MRIDIIAEHQINQSTEAQIGTLLRLCFPDYPPDRIFLKQKPSFRVLCFSEQSQLIGHISVENRMMNNGGDFISVYGLADVCVAPDKQQQKIATKMINYLEQSGQENGIDYLILLAWDPKVYKGMKFVQVNNQCRWLIIHRNQSLGLAQRRIGDGLMIKSIGQHQWKDGLLDFMGTVF